MRHFLQLLAEKFMKMQSHGSFLEKLQSFEQIDDFVYFFTNLATFWNLFLKSSSKHQNMVVCSKKLHSFGQCLSFRAFSRNEAGFATFCHKVHRNMVPFPKSCNFWRSRLFLVPFHEMRHFLQLLSEKFMKMRRQRSLLEKLPVLAKSMVFRFFFTK